MLLAWILIACQIDSAILAVSFHTVSKLSFVLAKLLLKKSDKAVQTALALALILDHSLAATLPEFSVYADTTNPYGDSEADFEEAGVTVDYADGTWIIDFGDLELGSINFYLKVVDADGNEFGSMYNGGYLTVSAE